MAVMHSDRRRVPRFPFGGVAEVSCDESSKHIVGSATKLSALGCFIKTPDALDKGLHVRLHITHGRDEFKVTGDVLYVQQQGMAVIFGPISPQDKTILNGWLSQAVPENVRVRQGMLEDFPLALTCPMCGKKTWTRVSELQQHTIFSFPCGHAANSELLLANLPARDTSQT